MGTRNVSAQKLAAQLGAGLDSVVPHEVEIAVADTVVHIRLRGTPWGMAADMRPAIDLPRPNWPAASGVVQRMVRVEDRDLRRRAAADAARATELEIDSVLDTLVGTLDQIQDTVAEIVTEPWPAVAPAAMPEPFVEVRDGTLVAGFGEPADPVLMLLLVRVDALR